ncbi:MAG: hypothetical protein H7147_02135 [Frankiaceae bacterium]|nr:hypothetical protein [Arenimonas sp.]
MSLLAELKRRNVIRMVGLYLVGAWLLVQVASTLFPAFGVPGWALRALVIVLALGFVPAVVFAWVFELTPDGIKRDVEVDPAESIAPETARRMDRMIIIVLALALAYFGFDKFVLAPSRQAAQIAQAVKSAAQEPAKAVAMKSIAVLPFENLSEDKANAYFATGMQDEILTRLAGIHDLKVISRTSTEQYASHPPNLKIVAEQLGVATVLEGSVQRADGKVRINLQLIDARNDSHLWAQNYDRDLKDVFAVQSDVAEKVANALKAQLLPAESARIASVPTKNQDAYDLFLKAEYFARKIESTTAENPAEVVRTAADLYERAIGFDPGFALAYARLSYLKAAAYWLGTDPSPQAIHSAQAAATQALGLQPNLPEAHLAMGYVHYFGRRDYATALAEFATARASRPNDTKVITAIAFVHRRQGKLLQAISEFRQAVVLDPRDPIVPGELCITFVYLRRYAEAVTACDRSLALAPDNIDAQVSRAAALRMSGDLEGAAYSLAAIPADYDPQGSASLARFNLAMAMRQPDAALAALANAPVWLLDNAHNDLIPAALLRGQALATKGETGPARTAFLDAQHALQSLSREAQAQADAQINLADVHAGLGQKDAALAAARRAVGLLPIARDMMDGTFYLARLAKIEAKMGETDSALKHVEQLLAAPAAYEVSVASLRTDPVWDPLRKDPRFQKLIAGAEAQPKIKR